MKETIKKKKLCFDFDERWIEVLLTKDVLFKEDVVKLIHEFNLNFTEKTGRDDYRLRKWVLC